MLTSNSFCGAVVEIESEWLRMSPPAGKGRSCLILQVFPDIEEGWRTWSTIQVLVGAANGEAGATLFKINGQRAGGMGEIPDGEGACVMGFSP